MRMKADPTFKPEYRGVFQYALGAPAKYGTRALFNGLIPHLVRNSVGGFCHFGAFEYIRREVAIRNKQNVANVGLGVNLFAGSVGGVLFWTVTYPVDVLKVSSVRLSTWQDFRVHCL